MSHPVSRHGSTAGARAAIVPLVRRQRENAAARRRRDKAVRCLADIAARTERRPRDQFGRARARRNREDVVMRRARLDRDVHFVEAPAFVDTFFARCAL